MVKKVIIYVMVLMLLTACSKRIGDDKINDKSTEKNQVETGQVDNEQKNELKEETTLKEENGEYPELYCINVGDHYGYIDSTGTLVFEVADIFYAYQFHEGYAAIIKDDQYGFIDTKGKITIAPQFSYASSFSEGLAAVWEEGSNKVGYINTEGKMIIEPLFDNGFAFREGRAVIVADDKYGYIDDKGTVVIEPIYDNAFDFSEGLAQVSVDGLVGYIDKAGEYVVDPQFADNMDYSFEGNFSEGLAKVVSQQSLKSGYIDKTGTYVIEPQYDLAGDFSEGLAFVTKEGISSYIDKRGAVAFETNSVYGFPFSEGFALTSVNKDGEEIWGFLNSKGDKVTDDPFIFNDGQGVMALASSRGFSNGVALVYDNDYNWGYIDKSGEWIWHSSEVKPSEIVNEVQEENEPPFGTWYFKNTLPGDVSAIGQEDVDKILNKTLTIEKEYCESLGGSIRSPYYEIEQISITKFREDNLVLDDWGINPATDEMMVIRLYEDRNKQIEWNPEYDGFGFELYYVDGRLIVDIAGVFFEMSKKD